MSVSRFEADTAVVADGPVWAGHVEPAWNVGSNPNGGYTLAIAARALLAESGRPDPLSVTAHYVAPPAPGPVTVHTETVRAGRRYATLAASMRQGDREAVRVLGAFGDLTSMVGPTRVGAVAPVLPPPTECPSLADFSEENGRWLPEVMRRYELRLDPGCEWFRSRVPGADPATGAGPLEVGGWIRFADGTPPSTLGLLAMVDAYPPTLIGAVDVGWIPTVELTVHVRARPAPGWIAGVCRTAHLVDGVLEQDGEFWDSEGRLVAQCRQLALVLPPR